MFYAPLSNVDIQIAAAASRLEMHLSTLSDRTRLDEAVKIIAAVAGELGGEILFDLRAGENINSDMHWVALRFFVEGGESIVHVLLGTQDEGFWIGQGEDLPERYARFAQTFADLYGRPGRDHLFAGTIVGSIH
ncbi:MAG: hypothetical protein K8F25_12165 [Fimbriimonadaceae bacterium]|nr:hypothetical protein [Alphaproteobacteria bacterium]